MIFIYFACIVSVFLVLGLVYVMNDDIDTTHETTGVVIDKTIIKFGFGSKEVCVIQLEDTRERTSGQGCLYSPGEKVILSVSKISGYTITGLDES